MKKIAKWAIPAVAAVALSACAQQEQLAPSLVQKGTRVHFSAAPLQTKTAFGEPTAEDGILSYPTLWTENDTQVAISLNLTPAVQADVVPSDDFTRADFEADFADSETSAPYTFYALSPASALEGVSPSRKALTFSVPAVQTPLPLSADEAAQLLVAKTEAADALPENVDVHFSHLTGYGRLTLKNLPEDAEISSVTLISPAQPWAGTWYYSTEDGTVEAKEASSSITLKTNATEDLWFACVPVDMKGKTLKISVATPTGKYEREITLNGKNVDFSAGHVYKFSVNMEDATFVENKKDIYYELVTDASSLKAGDEVIIANVLGDKISGNYAISTTQNNRNRPATEVTLEDDKIYDPSDEVEIFTIESGSTSGTWSFKTHDEKYISCATGNSNQLISNTNKSGYSSWTLSISGGKATMKAAQGSRPYLLYNENNGSPIFSCYTGTSVTGTTTSLVALYRKTESEASPASDDPILKEEVFGAYLNGVNTLYEKGIHQLSREYTGNTVTFALLDHAQNTIYEFLGIPAAAAQGDAFTLTFKERHGAKAISSADYPVTVVGEAGAKLWLSDGVGNGFIVKR